MRSALCCFRIQPADHIGRNHIVPLPMLIIDKRIFVEDGFMRVCRFPNMSHTLPNISQLFYFRASTVNNRGSDWLSVYPNNVDTCQIVRLKPDNPTLVRHLSSIVRYKDKHFNVIIRTVTTENPANVKNAMSDNFSMKLLS